LEAQITTMSTKGQVVIPEEVRDELGLEAGSKFVVYSRKDADVILLKRLDLPNPAEAFREMAAWARKHVRKQGLDASPEKIVELQHKHRKHK